MVFVDYYKPNHFINDEEYQIIDEIEILKNNFKNNQVNYTYNDITFELYNHNGKYYFFHCSIFDKILKTKKNPYNNQQLSYSILHRISLKKKLNDIIVILKNKKDEFNFNFIYDNFARCNTFYKNKFIFHYINYLNHINVNIKYINDNLILQIITNIGFDLHNKTFESEFAYASLGYLFVKYMQ